MAERQANPYRPGFNQAPAELAGREDILAAANEALDVAALDGRTPRPLILIGTRGVGKTVILNEIATIAATRLSWLTVGVEVRPQTPFLPDLIDRLEHARDLYRQAPPERPFTVNTATGRARLLGVGAEVTLTRKTERTPTLDDTLTTTMAAATDRSAGLVLTVDEWQLADRTELAELAAALQQHVPDNWPIVVVMAGLPGHRERRLSVTYLERGEWHELDLLDEPATLDALTKPALAAGRPFTKEAAQLLASTTGGYPYAIQVFGHHAWRRSTGAKTITLPHVHDTIPTAQRDLAAGLYTSRWDDATPAEQSYLIALATVLHTAGNANGSTVAAELGKANTAVSYLRDRLIRKGTIIANGRQLSFPVPGMTQWILDHAQSDS